MTRIKPTTLFSGLMFLAFITAFFLPHRISDRGRANVQALFAPVALPTRYFASVVHHRVWPDRGRDEASPDQPRDAQAVYRENDQLRVELANVIGQLEQYKVMASERLKLGPVADRCTPFTVMGADAGSRDSLNIVGASAGKLKLGTPALTPTGVIGRVERAGAGSATIVLLTDKQSKFTASIGRYVDSADGQLFEVTVQPTLIQGLGRGKMRAGMIEWSHHESGALRVNDWVVLDDTNWPIELKEYRVGKVVAIRQLRDSIMFAEVTIEPVADPRQLREVMVMDK